MHTHSVWFDIFLLVSNIDTCKDGQCVYIPLRCTEIKQIYPGNEHCCLVLGMSFGSPVARLKR